MSQQYVCGFYRVRCAFNDEIMSATMEGLNRLDAGFFPASFSKSKYETVVLEHPTQFSRSIIPEWCYFGPGLATMSFYAANGAQFSFTETDNAQGIPASLVMKFASTSELNGSDIRVLLQLVKTVVEHFAPDYACVYDQEQGDRQEYQDIMFTFNARDVPMALFWINYYSSRWVDNIGIERLRTFLSKMPIVEWLRDGSVLFAIQEEPYDEGNASHRLNQLTLEKELDLPTIQARFPWSGY